MEQHKKDRLNHLAKKSREAELSEEEKIEQAALREEYIREFRAHFQGILDHTVVETLSFRPTNLPNSAKKKQKPKRTKKNKLPPLQNRFFVL